MPFEEFKHDETDKESDENISDDEMMVFPFLPSSHSSLSLSLSVSFFLSPLFLSPLQMFHATSQLLEQLAAAELLFQNNSKEFTKEYFANSLFPPSENFNQKNTPANSKEFLHHSEHSIDGRILGDYIEWSFLSSASSHLGVTFTMNNYDEMLEGYYGLKTALKGESNVTTNEYLSGSYLCTHLLEVIIRPDLPSKYIMAGLQKIAGAERLR